MMKKGVIIALAMVVFLFAVNLVSAAPRVLHSDLNSATLFKTNGFTSFEKEVFFVPNQMFKAVGFFDGLYYVASGEGPEINVRAMNGRGKVKAEYVLEPPGQNCCDTFLDMTFDPKYIWVAVTNGKVAVYELAGSSLVRQFDVPSGYTSAVGIAYDPDLSQVYVLLVDESGLDRNQPIIWIIDPYGEELGRFALPGAITTTYFGLGYDVKAQEFWTSVSFSPFMGSDDHLVAFDNMGSVLRTIPIEHQYGSVECMNKIEAYVTEVPSVTALVSSGESGVLINGIRRNVGEIKVVFDKESDFQAKLDQVVLSFQASAGVSISNVRSYIEGGDGVYTGEVQLDENGKATLDLSVLNRLEQDGGEVVLRFQADIIGVGLDDFVAVSIEDTNSDFRYITQEGISYPELPYQTVQVAILSD